MRCATHPEVTTELTCNKCGKPICPRCMVYTPVGARCPECAQLRRIPTYDVPPTQYVMAIGVGIGAALVGGVAWALMAIAVPFAGFFVSMGVGYVLGELIGQSVNRKRGRGLQVIAGVSLFVSYIVSNITPLLIRTVQLGVDLDAAAFMAVSFSVVVRALLNPFAWLVIGIGVFVAVMRLK